MAELTNYTGQVYRRGSRGPVVGEIQTMLGNGYTDLGGTIDNDYGGKTRQAVWNWQTQWNNTHPDDQITVDGKVGSQTMPRLMQWYQSQQASGTPAPATADVPGSTTDGTLRAQPAGTIPPQNPQSAGVIDTSNAIGSLAELLGPTPAEREAQQMKLERNRNQMAMWAGLFDGLRHIGNLVYTSNGARPQQLSDPYAQIEQNYQRDKKNLDEMIANRQNYARQLYVMQRQAENDELGRSINKAKSDYYGALAKAAQSKGVKLVKNKDGSIMKYDPESDTVEQLTEADPLYREYVQSQINRNNRAGTGSGRNSGEKSTYGYKTVTYYDEQGRKVTERVPTTGKQPTGKEQPTTAVKEPKKPQTQQRKPAAKQKGNGKGNSKTVDPDKLKGFSIHRKQQ